MGIKHCLGHQSEPSTFNYNCEKDTLFPGVALRKYYKSEISCDLTTSWEESVQKWSHENEEGRFLAAEFK